ncbi:hypothetical protein [Saccharospirillum salsuginis]|uniref:Uncharacterized protein n=1 Tax=Saccharospirillum salsuginis TaxID=418750 RepID=A0A918NEF2_9GAMM|nr:hypothetical protein [Saccharospirillum salsuginis]GGX64444.1 hypothetical protein GCM10007392_35270 [Saccharospirillum salsuginis]
MTANATAIADSTPTLVFLRRQQVADMIIELSFNEAARQQLPTMKGLLIDALYHLPPKSFIADDWSCILNQVIKALLLQQETQTETRMPAPLLGAISQLERRL